MQKSRFILKNVKHLFLVLAAKGLKGSNHANHTGLGSARDFLRDVAY